MSQEHPGDPDAVWNDRLNAWTAQRGKTFYVWDGAQWTPTKKKWADLDSKDKSSIIQGGGCLIIVGVIVAIFVIGWIWSAVAGGDNKSGDSRNEMIDAYIACQMRAEPYFKSPSSVDWPVASQTGATQSEGVWKFAVRPEATNSFGAKIATPVICWATPDKVTYLVVDGNVIVDPT